MTVTGWLQLALYALLLTALAWPLGGFMARVYRGERTFLHPVLAPAERGLYRAAGVDPGRGQDWREYALAMLLFNLLGLLAVYAIQRGQGWLGLNPQGLPGVPPNLAFNTAVSFATNTNWQSYGGETTLSYATQMLALTIQNFVSAATGMAMAVALVRGFAGVRTSELGNFWADLVRGTLYVLLPLSILLALALTSQGVLQNLSPYVMATTLDGGQQALAQGPTASQVAIKQLGTNGGGFFNVNSAHPYENPTILSNWLQCLAILLIPAALVFTFGKLIGNERQGRALYTAMGVVFLGALALTYLAESIGNPLLAAAGVDGAGGNMEGKEVRFGLPLSSLWAVATTAASNGSVNAMHDSFTPLGGLVPMFLIQLGEIIFGGVGSGLYGMLLYAIIAVFVAGLMVGRTPEYLGKKIEGREVKLAILALLTVPLGTLVGTALGLGFGAGGVQDAGPHGLSEVLYAYSSAAGNNGSAFAGLTANIPVHNVLLGLAMLICRYGMIVPMLAIAGSLAAKKQVPPSPGTFPTDGALFVGLLVGVILIIGGLTFFPALALGPIVEHLAMLNGRTF